MKVSQGNREIDVNTTSNWPLIEDLFIKWGYSVVSLELAKAGKATLQEQNVEKLGSELSVWGIPWKRTKWDN